MISNMKAFCTVLFSLTEAPIAKSAVDAMRGKIPEGEVGINC